MPDYSGLTGNSLKVPGHMISASRVPPGDFHHSRTDLPEPISPRERELVQNAQRPKKFRLGRNHLGGWMAAIEVNEEVDDSLEDRGFGIRPELAQTVPHLTGQPDARGTTSDQVHIVAQLFWEWRCGTRTVHDRAETLLRILDQKIFGNQVFLGVGEGHWKVQGSGVRGQGSGVRGQGSGVMGRSF